MRAESRENTGWIMDKAYTGGFCWVYKASKARGLGPGASARRAAISDRRAFGATAQRAAINDQRASRATGGALAFLP
jgi:hypothetical protein